MDIFTKIRAVKNSVIKRGILIFLFIVLMVITLLPCDVVAVEKPKTLSSSIQKFADHILNWFDPSDGEFHDPYETYYGEGYGPGVASVVFAQTYRLTGKQKYLQGAKKSINRCFELIQSPKEGHSKFTDMFLVYWALIGYEEIREQVPLSLRNQWEKNFTKLSLMYEPHNTNGQAMLISHKLNLHVLGIRNVDKSILNEGLKRIEASQNALGFIDDAFDKDAKPIAYHLFTTSLLGYTLALFNKYEHGKDLSDLMTIRNRIKSVIAKAMVWMDHFTASDGSFTMAERSRDQFWTCGAFVFLQTLRGKSIKDHRIKKHVDWWFRFQKQDGTISITPNYFSNALRVGFEGYSIVTMYNTLGFALLSLSDEVESKKLHIESLPPIVPLKDDLFIDKEAGYLHWRSEGSSVGVSLRRHAGSYFGGYSPAMSIMNLSMNGSKLRPIPNPSYRFSEEYHGLYEGFRASESRINRTKTKFLKTTTYGPDIETNADVFYDNGGVILTQKYRDFDLIKTIALGNASLSVTYRFTLTNSLGSLYIEVPILISDGKIETKYRIRKNKVFIEIYDERYELTTNAGNRWQIDKRVSLFSTTGVSRVLYITISKSLKKGDIKEVSWILKRVK